MNKQDQKQPKVEPTKVEETKSSKIRKLHDEGVPVGDIARKLGIRYEFAYQVSKRYAQSKGEEFKTNREAGPSKADRIRELLAQGMKKSDIAKEVGTYQPYVYTIAKEVAQEEAGK